MINFTNCKVLNKAYGGANGNKLCIIYNNTKYMLKFPSHPTKKTMLSYANGCISEYISCHIYQMLEIPVQETILGLYYVHQNPKLVVACKDFTSPGIILQDFASIKNQVIDSEHQGRGTDLPSVLDAILSHPNIDNSEVLNRFWDMFIIDAFLGNFDRHNGNWGFLYNEQTDSLTLAPVYDCGSCLYPQADKETIQKILSNEGERHTRVYNFPTSALQENGRKISYYTFLTNTNNENCLQAILRNFEKIDLSKIYDFIDSIKEIDLLQKQFYKTMLQERYDRILVNDFSSSL